MLADRCAALLERRPDLASGQLVVRQQAGMTRRRRLDGRLRPPAAERLGREADAGNPRLRHQHRHPAIPPGGAHSEEEVRWGRWGRWGRCRYLTVPVTQAIVVAPASQRRLRHP